MFAALGAELIDADVLSREVVAPGSDGLRAVTERFGSEVLDSEGALDRAALAQVVFRDGSARARLESIVHPRVRARSAEIIAALPQNAVVVEDIPLLTETGAAPNHHLALAVEAPLELRLERLTGRGMARDEAQRRIDNQASEKERRRACDVVLDNSGDERALELQVQRLWRERIEPFAANMMSARSAAESEKLRFIVHDEGWEQRFEHTAARLRRIMGSSAVRIDHVGSTAVPGLPATDVIDVQVTVVALSAVERMQSALERAGYFPIVDGRDVSQSGRIPDIADPESTGGQQFLYGSADPGNIVHIHFRAMDGIGRRLAVLFRDWLRQNESARVRYAAEKEEWAARVDSYQEYRAAKESWFRTVGCPEAQEWAHENGWSAPVC